MGFILDFIRIQILFCDSQLTILKINQRPHLAMVSFHFQQRIETIIKMFAQRVTQQQIIDEPQFCTNILLALFLLAHTVCVLATKHSTICYYHIRELMLVYISSSFCIDCLYSHFPAGKFQVQVSLCPGRFPITLTPASLWTYQIPLSVDYTGFFISYTRLVNILITQEGMNIDLVKCSLMLGRNVLQRPSPLQISDGQSQ